MSEEQRKEPADGPSAGKGDKAPRETRLGDHAGGAAGAAPGANDGAPAGSIRRITHGP